MKKIYSTGNRDDNEKIILEFLARHNIHNVQLKPGAGADLIVSIAPMEYWEIKNPSQPPSKRKLTNDEKHLLEYCTTARIPYVVIETIEDAAARIDQYFRREHIL